MQITLYVPYFRPKDDARQRELVFCLQQNRSSTAFDRICLMIDDDAEADPPDPKVEIVRFKERPTYADWVQLTYAKSAEHISVLANADIYFDSSILELRQLFDADPNAFVALSRHDLKGEEISLHPNPHWSQDAWAFVAGRNRSPNRDAHLQFPMGVPRCDNKVAFIFAVYGHKIYNPCHAVRAIHVHQSDIRSYDKKGDLRIVGGVAMVHPGDALLSPAKLDLEVWAPNMAQFSKISLNRTLERWTREEREQQRNVPASPSLQQSTQPAACMIAGTQNRVVQEMGIIGYDQHWQFPAITEKHAFLQMRLFAPRQSRVAYLGFPWATLIDLLSHNSSDTARIHLLQERLRELAELAKGYTRVVTVCQHIRMLGLINIFAEAGITDIYWSHTVRGQFETPSFRIRLHPFPLYPVQVSDDPELPFQSRKYLFSFVGAKASNIYLTQARNYIIEELSKDARGLVIDRAIWHYNALVYDAQVRSRKAVSDDLVDRQASNEFREVMRQTKFTLCPSGTGPNSIRLWEALASGSIPVLLADSYRAPLDGPLWRQAVVPCAETREAIRNLPEKLERIAANRSEMRRRRDAMRLVALRYSPAAFVSDVLKLMYDASEQSA